MQMDGLLDEELTALQEHEQELAREHTVIVQEGKVAVPAAPILNKALKSDNDNVKWVLNHKLPPLSDFSSHSYVKDGYGLFVAVLAAEGIELLSAAAEEQVWGKLVSGGAKGAQRLAVDDAPVPMPAVVPFIAERVDVFVVRSRERVCHDWRMWP